MAEPPDFPEEKEVVNNYELEMTNVDFLREMYQQGTRDACPCPYCPVVEVYCISTFL